MTIVTETTGTHLSTIASSSVVPFPTGIMTTGITESTKPLIQTTPSRSSTQGAEITTKPGFTLRVSTLKENDGENNSNSTIIIILATGIPAGLIIFTLAGVFIKKKLALGLHGSSGLYNQMKSKNDFVNLEMENIDEENVF